MIVVVDGARSSVEVEDADVLDKLCVELRECTHPDAALLLYGLGWFEDDHAWLDIEELRARSPLSGTGNWDSRYEATMIYARTKGWTDQNDEHVQAHVVVALPSPSPSLA